MIKTGSKRKAAKAPGTKRKTRKKPCAHTHANFDTIWNGQRVEVMGCYAIWYGDDPQFGYGKYRKIFGARCLGCGVQLPLGPANDEDNSYVHEEMAAAEFARQRGIVDVAVQQGFLDHADDADPPELVGPGWRAGWLAHEVVTHDARADRDADAWAWDPKRPIAKQDEPWMRPNEHDLRNACVNAGLVAIGLTPRQLREQTAAQVAAEDALRDPEVMARNARRITGVEALAAGTGLGISADDASAMLAMNGRTPMVPPTADNCRLLGASRCSHDEMTAEETQAVFGKELQDG